MSGREVDVTGLVDATTLAALDGEDLAVALRPLWEDAGPLVERLAGRAVPSWEAHLEMAAAEIDAMDPATRARLLRAHPRLGTDPAVLAARSRQSWAEQGGATATEPAVVATLASRNDEYEARFGFPFVEWVAGRSVAEMVPVIEARLQRNRDAELEAGCAALVAIAHDRLARLRSGAS